MMIQKLLIILGFWNMTHWVLLEEYHLELLTTLKSYFGPCLEACRNRWNFPFFHLLLGNHEVLGTQLHLKSS
jgi:hypothetical protein